MAGSREEHGSQGSDLRNNTSRYASKTPPQAPLTSLFTTTALQTSASRIGTMQADMRSLLRTYLANFVAPGCLVYINTDNIEVFDYRDVSQHASNDKLAIGTSTRLLLEEYSDDVEGTSTERKFFTAVRSFYQEVFFFFFFFFLHKDTCPPNHINVTNNWNEEKEVRTGVGKD